MPELPPDERRIRRRFARRQWARRWMTLRYLVASVVTLLLVGFAGYAIWYSPWLLLQEVEVRGNQQLSEQRILRSADLPLDQPLARADLAAIEVRVAALATVESVEVSRHWPRGLRIDVVERVPVAVIARDSGFTQLDATGVTFGNLDEAPDDLPEVRRGPGADRAALAEAAAVVSALAPDVATLVAHVEVASVDQVTLRLRDGRTVRWGSADRSEDKARVLLGLFRAEEDGEIEPARHYDVSVPGMPTTS